MLSKNCNKCGKLKLAVDFHKHKKGKHGLKSACKDCVNLHTKNYSRTKDGLAATIYSSQKQTSRKRGHDNPDYSLAELREWLFAKPEFTDLYEKWVESGYETQLSPSCDRFDDYKPYTFDNMRLTTWRENKAKYIKDVKSGANTKQCRKVSQSTLNGELKIVFFSQMDAARKTGISRANIQKCCSGKRKTAGGYNWSYA